MKVKIPVDRNRLAEAVETVEKDGPLDCGMTELLNRIAQEYNRYALHAISGATAGNRIQEFGLTLKTPRARRGRPSKNNPGKKKTKAEKFAESPLAQLSLDLLRKQTPETFHYLVDKIAAGSRAAAVKLNCIECSGYFRPEVKRCTVTTCPMYLFRPFQLSEETEDGEIVDDQEETDDNE